MVSLVQDWARVSSGLAKVTELLGLGMAAWELVMGVGQARAVQQQD
jgi:hypothetical protein